MVVTSICSDDYANFMYDNANALRSVGLEVHDLKINPHQFGYENQSKVTSLNEMRHWVKKSDVLQIFHSDAYLFQLTQNLCKKIVVHHTGTPYRMAYKHMNRVFNVKCKKSILALGEFERLGSIRPEYVVGSIDIDKYKPKYIPKSRKVKFGHYPSNPQVKGTGVINRAIGKVGVEYLHSVEKVNYKDQLKRMSKCDVYIELFAPKQDGRPYGSWGITALEAAALGKVVITNHTSKAYYEKFYPKSELEVVSTPNELEAKIRQYNQMSIGEIRAKQEKTRKWIEDNHSYVPTGNRLKNILYGL